MGAMTRALAFGGRRIRTHAEKLLRDIPAERFARLPALGGVIIQTNHPAWVCGHLSLYPARMLRMVGMDASPAAPPDRWTDLFKGGSPCLDDPSGKHYPPRDELVSTLLRASAELLDRVEGIEDEILDRPNPDEQYRQVFPTVGAAFVVLLCSHVAMHMGQVSAWRRCMGMGPAT